MLDGFCPQKKYGIAFLPTCGARLKHKWSTGVAQFIIRAQFVDKNCTKRAQNRKKETEMNAMKKKIAVKVVSDTICPWCYIGKKRLESAIQSFTASSSASVEFEVRHVPYLLLPQLPKEGLDKRAFYRKRVGEERYGVMVRSLQELGKSLNIKFKEDGTIGNTVLSHRLLEYAHRKGKQQEVLLIFSLFLIHCLSLLLSSLSTRLFTDIRTGLQNLFRRRAKPSLQRCPLSCRRKSGARANSHRAISRWGGRPGLCADAGQRAERQQRRSWRASLYL
ncbi:DsbA family oxidoreductase [Balamuthia mandrillaris]